jgi:S1-C subfamily serine protease
MRPFLIPIISIVYAFTAFNSALAEDVFANGIFEGDESSGISLPAIPSVNDFVTSKVLLVYRSILNKPRENLNFKLRGRSEIAVYKNISPSVVLLVNEDSTGSGIVIQNGIIVTNYHVVGQNEEIGVVFKPKSNRQKLTATDVTIGKVVATDQKTDLALIRITTSAPSIPLNTQMPDVGADVHAIGHPHQQNWTYTKGFVSQTRRGFKWSSKLGGDHLADVIQTQTPINPGNSGGPLVNGSGELVGINSFKRDGAEGLNFAVASKEVLKLLLRAKQNGFKPIVTRTNPSKKCKYKILFEGRTAKDDGDLKTVDSNCDGKHDISIYSPDDQSIGNKVIRDRDFNGKMDTVIVDSDRDGLWDVSYYDTDGDGKTDLVGHHPDGAIKASKYEKYVKKKS